MPDIRELKDQATKHFAKGKFDKAAADYEELCRLEPKDMQLRVRLGDACVKKGDKVKAVGAYRAAAESYAKEGFLPRAIAVCKLILEVDPSHVETQSVLAQLYAKKTAAPSTMKPVPAMPAHPASAAAPVASPAPVAPVAPRPPARAAVLVPPAPGEEPLELDTAPRGFEVGVKGAAAPAPAPAAEEPLELDTGSSAGANWKGASTAWESPSHSPPAPAPAPTAVAAPPAAPKERAAPALAPVAPPPPSPPKAKVETSSPMDDVLFTEGEEPEPEAQPAPPVSLKEVDLGEPELLGLQQPAPKPASPPPAARWVAPSGPAVADSLAAALEGVASGPAEAVAAPAAPAAAGQSSWFSEPEGTREDPSRRRPTLADLAIATVEEEEEIEVLSVTVEAEAPAEPALPQIPLFSDLSHEAFVELASQCALKRCQPGDVVVEQGSIGSSFFVLTSGTVKVVKKSEAGETVLARLNEGSFFGEMALLSGAPRAASVVAEDEAECLEISAALLASLTRRWPHVGQALKKFCRQRLLNNVMATSPLFRPFDKDNRRALVARFKARELPTGEVVLVEGQPADGLYVVMAGEVEVRKRKDGKDVSLASLREGELFGEISLLTKSAATATVAAVRPTTILRLPRATFDELISTHPQILALVSELSDDRLKAQQAFGQGKLAGEGLLLL